MGTENERVIEMHYCDVMYENPSVNVNRQTYAIYKRKGYCY